MTRIPRHSPALLLLAATVTATLTGCGGNSGGGANPTSAWQRPTDGGTATLKQFTGDNACQQLETYIEDSLLAQLAETLESQRRNDYSTAPGAGGAPVPVSAPAPAPAASDNAPESSVSHSTTTLRTTGVDEADTVKTDGRHLYTLRTKAGQLSVSRTDLAGAGQMAVGATLAWPVPPETVAEGLYLREGGRVVALALHNPYMAYPAPLVPATPGTPGSSPGIEVNAQAKESQIPPARQQSVSIRQIDLAGVSPTTDWEVQVQGGLLGSRRIGDQLHLVTQAQPQLPAGVASYVRQTYAAEDIGAAVDRQLAENERLIRAVNLATWLAPLAPNGQASTPTTAECQAFARVDAPTPLGYLQLTTIDLTTQASRRQTLLARAGGIYLSPTSLILLSSGWEDSNTLKTALHRFTADKGGQFAYQGSGRIDGHLINDYAIDEDAAGIVRVVAQNGNLRTAGHSYIATLEPAAAPKAWREVGRSEPIAPGESLMSTRFVGDRVYLVTFLQVDPFFVYDLSDPSRPTALGELKIPGYSSWLQPVGANHILGIGHSDGRMNEIKASLFDVSNPRQPVEQSTLVLGSLYTSSEALWNPHAFSWYSPEPAIAGLPSGGTEGTFALPFTTSGYYYGPYAPDLKTGVMVVSVRPSAGHEALSLNGSLSLTDLASAQGWSAGMAQRAVFVDSMVYGISDTAVRSAPIATPAEPIQTVTLP